MATQPNPTLSHPRLPADVYNLSLLLAAQVVVAHLTGRAPLRLDYVTLDQVEYVLPPDVIALRGNRGLMEDVVMTALAGQAAATLLGLAYPAAFSFEREARQLLELSLVDPEEQATIDAYLMVLEARTRVTLRRVWAEIQVVASGLREHGTLDAEAVKHRVACAQGIRSTLLN